MSAKLLTSKKIVQQDRLYVVEVDPSRNYGGLHTLTARHLLARSLSAGDKVAATIGVLKLCEVRDGYLDCVEVDVQPCVGDTIDGNGRRRVYRVESHAGRSATLGEDTLDEAYGRDALADLIPEALGHEYPWIYAPVELVEIEDEAAQRAALHPRGDRTWRRDDKHHWHEVERAKSPVKDVPA